MQTIRFIRIIFIGIFFLGASLSFLLVAGKRGDLSVSFLDVGQGDAIYIVSPTGRELLIDGGRDGAVIQKLSLLKPFWDNTFDIILETHPDLDHIGGLFSVFRHYSSDVIFLSYASSSTSFDESLLRVAQEEEKKNGSRIIYAEEGQEFDLGGGVHCMILFPQHNFTAKDTNDYSTAVLLSYGEKSFLFMGDAPQDVENRIISQYSLKNITVLKAGHHGSDTSTSPEFLAETKPSYTILSVGKDNTYGHPHPRVLSLLEKFKTTILRTDESGTITFKVSAQGEVRVFLEK
jgi:competence protein ComEC